LKLLSVILESRSLATIELIIPIKFYIRNGKKPIEEYDKKSTKEFVSFSYMLKFVTFDLKERPSRRFNGIHIYTGHQHIKEASFQIETNASRRC
jgi:hypothetical protein